MAPSADDRLANEGANVFHEVSTGNGVTRCNTAATIRRVIPGVEAFNIEVHDILGNDAHAVALVHYDHRREGRAFSQLGAEVCHFDEEGKVSAFWALIDDTAAFDEFFA